MGKYTDNELKAVGWFRGGYALMTSGLYDEAIEALAKQSTLTPMSPASIPCGDMPTAR